MRKVSTLLALLMTTCVGLNAQTYFEENFDSSNDMPANWYVTDNGIGGQRAWGIYAEGLSQPNAAAIGYENVSSGSIAIDYLITPEIDLNGSVNPALSFSVKQTYPADYGSDFYVMVSTTSQTDISSFTTVATWDETQIDTEYETLRVDLSDYVGESIYVAFVMSNDDGDNFFVDDVKVGAVLDRDASVTAITTPSIVAPSSVDVSATVQNEGTSQMNSFTANWQVDNGDVHTQDFSNVNLGLGENVTITFNDSWNATVGEYDLKVWVSNINDAGADDLADNDSLIKTVSVASNSVQRTPLYEEFTSSTCGPCANFNTNTFNLNYIEEHEEEMTLIKYQVNWPGSGDPYNTPEVNERRQYYGVSGVPTLLIDGIGAAGSSSNTLANQLEDLRDAPAFFEIEGAHQITGDNINVDLKLTPYLSGEYTVHVAVVEENTTGNVSTNGETSFEYVMMKMLPNASGTVVSFNDNQEYTVSMSADLSSTFVEEMDDLKVVVFIQDENTQEIMQSGYAQQGSLSVNNISSANKSLNFAPNPTDGNLTVYTDSKANVTIYDLTGKKVYQAFDLTNAKEINISNLDKGVYFIQMDAENATKVDKLIVK